MIEVIDFRGRVRNYIDRTLELKAMAPLKRLIEKAEDALASYRDKRFQKQVALRALYDFSLE